MLRWLGRMSRITKAVCTPKERHLKALLFSNPSTMDYTEVVEERTMTRLVFRVQRKLLITTTKTQYTTFNEVKHENFMDLA